MFLIYYIHHTPTDSYADIEHEIFENSDDAYRHAFIKNLQYTIDYDIDTVGEPDDYLTNENHTYEERCKYFEQNTRLIFRDSDYKLYKVKEIK